MANTNKAIIIGYVAVDPQILDVKTGKMAKLVIPTDETHLNKQTNEKTKVTSWHHIVAFGKLAEIIETYVKKGTLLYVEGNIHYSKFLKDNVECISMSIRANSIEMLGKKPTEEGNSANQTASHAQNKGTYGEYKSTHGNKKPHENFHDDELLDDELPF